MRKTKVVTLKWSIYAMFS